MYPICSHLSMEKAYGRTRSAFAGLINVILIDTNSKIGVSVYHMKSLARPRARSRKEPRAYDMSNRAAQAEATRTRIRQAAAALYRARSLDEFTLEEVARRAEVTVQTVLRAFKSKDQLI